MPGYVLHHGGVTRENGLGVDNFVFGGGVDVPQADGVVIAVADRDRVWPPTQFSMYAFFAIHGVFDQSGSTPEAVLPPFRQSFLTSGSEGDLHPYWVQADIM